MEGSIQDTNLHNNTGKTTQLSTRQDTNSRPINSSRPTMVLLKTHISSISISSTISNSSRTNSSRRPSANKLRRRSTTSIRQMSEQMSGRRHHK